MLRRLVLDGKVRCRLLLMMGRATVLWMKATLLSIVRVTTGLLRVKGRCLVVHSSRIRRGVLLRRHLHSTVRRTNSHCRLERRTAVVGRLSRSPRRRYHSLMVVIGIVPLLLRRYLLLLRWHLLLLRWHLLRRGLLAHGPAKCRLVALSCVVLSLLWRWWWS